MLPVCHLYEYCICANIIFEFVVRNIYSLLFDDVVFLLRSSRGHNDKQTTRLCLLVSINCGDTSHKWIRTAHMTENSIIFSHSNRFELICCSLYNVKVFDDVWLASSYFINMRNSPLGWLIWLEMSIGNVDWMHFLQFNWNRMLVDDCFCVLFFFLLSSPVNKRVLCQTNICIYMTMTWNH